MYRDIKFSLWCDFLERDFINGEFLNLIENSVINGATSNPSIFKSAICSSCAYALLKDEYKRKSPKELYEILATTDIKMAANKLLKNYANDDDGFVSLEVDPNLYDDSEGTYKEGKRLFNIIKMPNVMIKVPATGSGYEAMSDLMKKGINVNATLVFSISQVKECLEAFSEGSRAYAKRFPGTPLPKGVISIFVSRFDRLLDKSLKNAGLETSKFGIYNATKAYKIIEQQDNKNIRALFASTGVKGDELPADYYIKELLYKNSINTAPLNTIKEFIKDISEPKSPLECNVIDEYFDRTKKADINYEKSCKILLEDGLKAFCEAFDDILTSLK
ncbi:transaldolase [Campylobacter fetus]|uniref:transaldolase n=1 Tax=Campylobacter fetus TaxID=196 RepID=UPI000FCC2D51|nr:transaldolase [Campylobacter fetus]RUT49917.1 transaldolase [Campylobacter fetus]RUT50178.1 transaldolase [Campylobacter fetus]